MVIGVTDDHVFLQASIIFTFRMQKNTIADLLILESYEWKYEVLYVTLNTIFVSFVYFTF